MEKILVLLWTTIIASPILREIFDRYWHYHLYHQLFNTQRMQRLN